MPLAIKNLHTVDSSGDYIVEVNVDINLRTATKSTPDDPLLVRANVYRPKLEGKFPVLVTYGPCKFELGPWQEARAECYIQTAKMFHTPSKSAMQT